MATDITRTSLDNLKSDALKFTQTISESARREERERRVNIERVIFFLVLRGIFYLVLPLLSREKFQGLLLGYARLISNSMRDHRKRMIVFCFHNDG